MSHAKLLKQGKISRREYNDLEYYKTNDPSLYKIAEKGYSKRPKGFREDHPDRYYYDQSGHIQRAEMTR